MTKEYVQMVGRMAYFWGWPLVANPTAPWPSPRRPSLDWSVASCR